MRLILTLFFLALVTIGVAQKKATILPPKNGENIVPNPSFERFGGVPIGWSYNGAYFRQVVKYWFSATTASPDIYGPGVTVPSDWAEKGFGDQKPRTGKAMAGITVYGCENGKPHCREYVEIQLAEPLVEGQTYQVEYWVAPLGRSLHINNLGAYFSVNPIERKTDEVLVRDAQIQSGQVAAPAKRGQWVKISGTFKAKYEAEHVLIGNFNSDENTLSVSPNDDAYNYAYYYIEDVLVKKIPPYLAVPVKADDLTKIPLKQGETIPLKNIYFEFDKDELLPRSYIELYKLLKIMQTNPTMCIDLMGHTDDIGADEYNLNLSRRRAQAVVDFLKNQGVSIKRLVSHGLGETKPIASNETDEGRSQNRRVEFLITKK